jgi:hypothetical protein
MLVKAIGQGKKNIRESEGLSLSPVVVTIVTIKTTVYDTESI